MAEPGLAAAQGLLAASEGFAAPQPGRAPSPTFGPEGALNEPAATPVANPLISVSDFVAGEADGTAEFVVSLSAPGINAVSVNYATSSFTALSGSDFTAASGTLNFAPGETSKTVVISILNDTSVEGLQSLRLTLSGASGGSIFNGVGTGLIVDNDDVQATPEIYVRDIVVDEKQGTATFMVTLGEAVGQRSVSTVTVDYATANGSAVAGSDYVAASGTLSFAPGESVKLVTVDLIDDGTAEGAERFYLNLSNASGGNIVQGQALATIGLSDGSTSANPLITVKDMVVDETDGFVDIVVSLSAPSASTVTVDYATASWTALNGSDFEGVSGTLKFLAGETTKTVRVELINNTDVSTFESFKLNLSNASGATIHDGIGEVLMVDNDDNEASPQIYVRDIVIDEKAGTATFMVTLGEAVGQNSTSTVTVDYATANGSAVAGSDYVAASGTLSFAPGESVKLVTVDLIDDGTAEGAERFYLNL
ncbi:Calx-beta domain-containing protein, partial [Rubrivivax albus]